LVVKSVKSVLSNPTGESLPLGEAFRRLIQILSAGIFLPGSVGLTDPCAPGPYRIHTTLTLEEQDGICMTAQVNKKQLTSKSLQIQANSAAVLLIIGLDIEPSIGTWGGEKDFRI
jgi:hypothetical protein